MSGTPKPLEIVLTQHAERDLLRISNAFRQRVKADIVRLAEGRLPIRQVKKLSGYAPPLWQLTSGSYRVIYRRFGEQLLLLRVVHKPEQARALRSLR